MRAVLAFTAASLAIALPAPTLAESLPTLAFRSGDMPALSHGRHGPRDGYRRDLRHRRGDAILIYDREYQGDTVWRSTGFNDWWHEKTERSYPRWIQNNAGCERQWYAGDTLRC